MLRTETGQDILIRLAAYGVVFALAVSAPAAAGEVFYVGPNGSNTNPGTREKPWATPGFASRQLKPGQTLVILGGTYILREYDDDIIVPPSGRPGAWITIRGEKGRRPVLAGRDNLLAAMELRGASYVRIENLEITHDPKAKGKDIRFRDAILIVDDLCEHLIFQDLYIHRIDEFGMNFQDVNHVDIVDCRIEYCGFGAIGGPEGARGGWRNARIKGCRLSYGGHYFEGTDGRNRPYDRPDGVGLEAGQGPIEIVACVAEHNRGDGLDSKAANTFIRNCVAANNNCDGIKLWGDNSKIVNCLVYGTGDGTGGASPWAGIVIDTQSRGARFEIVNTTVHDNPARKAYPMYIQYGESAPISLVMRNCIIAGGHGPVFFGRTAKVTLRNNLFFRGRSENEQVQVGEREYTSADVARGALGPGNLCGDPRFVRPAWGKVGDYRLRSGSPAIDAGGRDAAVRTDLDGRKRPRGNGIDMGAYEK